MLSSRLVQEKGLPLVGLLVVILSILGAILVLSPARAYADECPAGGDHDYAVVILKYATETDDGIRQYTCRKCGNTFTNAIPATGHLWSDWMVYQEPTCTSDGIEYRVCTRYPNNPHYEYRTVPALSPSYAHSYVETDRTEPTCTEPGSVTYVCSVCGDAYTDTLEALGHDWGAWVVDREPTSDVPGSEHRTCLRDSSHVEYQDIPVVAATPAPPEPSEETEPAEVEEPQPDTFWTLQPNELDQRLAIADGVVFSGFAALLAPLVSPLLWIRRKKREAHEAFLRNDGNDASGSAESDVPDKREGDRS